METRCWTKNCSFATWTTRSLYNARFQMAGLHLYLCYRQLGETALAEEASQDVFIKVYTSIHTFRKKPSLTWLYRLQPITVSTSTPSSPSAWSTPILR